MTRETAALSSPAPRTLRAQAGRVARQLGGRRQREREGELHALIVAFLRETAAGRVRTSRGKRYARDEVRELRAALTHVSIALGSLDVREVRAWHVEELIDELRAEGASPGRVAAVGESIRSLYAYAARRGLVDADAPREPAFRVESRPAQVPSPTEAMLALTGRVATWTARIVIVAFLLIVIGLGYELGLLHAIRLP